MGARVPSDVLEHVVALYSELRRQHTRPTATPEEARVANAELRDAMRERGNYFPEIEEAAAQALDRVGYRGGALSQGALLAIVSQHGFAVRYAQAGRVVEVGVRGPGPLRPVTRRRRQPEDGRHVREQRVAVAGTALGTQVDLVDLAHTYPVLARRTGTSLRAAARPSSGRAGGRSRREAGT